MKRVLCLGAGVQSSALLLLSCRGRVPKLDHAIFADTGWEPTEVYDFLDFLRGEAKKAGIPVSVVKYDGGATGASGDLRADTMNNKRFKFGLQIPVHIKSHDGKPDGINIRQCTGLYKARPINTFIRREILGLRHGQRAPKDISVERWFGITVDEVQRVRFAEEPWALNVYPFIGIPTTHEMLDKRWDRSDCDLWIRENYPGVTPVKSACIGCPYRTDAAWAWVKSVPEYWRDVVELDEAIRSTALPTQYKGTPYLHKSKVPLSEADFGQSQTTLFDGFNQECEGLCGV